MFFLLKITIVATVQCILIFYRVEEISCVRFMTTLSQYCYLKYSSVFLLLRIVVIVAVLYLPHFVLLC